MDLKKIYEKYRKDGRGAPAYEPGMMTGIVKTGLVALDGTKFKANASLDANSTRETINKKVKEMLKEAEETDKREDAEEKLRADKGDKSSAKARREERIRKFKKEKNVAR